MTRRTVQNTLIATAAAGALITTPALARPADDQATGPSGTPATPHQDLRGADARGDAPRPYQYPHITPTWGSHPETLPKAAVPGQPTWPADPKPLPRTVPAEVPASGDTGNGNGHGGESVWLILGLGLGGAGLVAGGAAGLARHSRVRARRVAV